MKTLLDSELKNILQEKLGDLEAEVPVSVEQAVFDSLPPSGLRMKMITRAGIIVVGLLMIAPVYYFGFRKDTAKRPIVGKNFDHAAKINAKADPDEEKRAIEKINILAVSPGTHFKNTSNGFSRDRNRPKGNTASAHDESVPETLIKDETAAHVAAQNTILLTSAETAVQDSSDQAKKEELADKIVLDSSSASTNKSKTRRKFNLVLSAQPFLTYKHIRPLTDGIHLYNFRTPRALASSRLGIKLGISAEFEFAAHSYLTFGVSVFQNRSSMSYQANEAAKGIQISNSISDREEGIALDAGIRYPVKIAATREQYLRVGASIVHVSSPAYTSSNQMLLLLGYENHFRFFGNGLRVTPLVSYGLTTIHYPGVLTNQYWLGMELGYAFKSR